MAANALAPAVLVTGATGGVGSRLVERLRRGGYLVFAGARTSTSAASSDSTVVPLALDVTDGASITAAAGELEQRLGGAGLFAVVNVAGIVVEGPLEVVDGAEFSRQFEVNVKGPFAVTQAVLPLLKQAKGRVVNIGAATARTTVPFFGPVSASKAALASISDAMRMEFAPFGIQVVLIEPGALRTGIFATSAALIDRTLQRQPEKAAFYGPVIAAMQAASEKAGADDPSVVVDAVMTALQAPRPNPRVLVGKGAGQLRLLARLPIAMRDTMLMNALGISKAMQERLAYGDASAREPIAARSAR